MSCKAIGIGEVLWDLFSSGPQLGGAPANFALHARALGADAKVVTRIGNDSLGREILLRLGDQGIADDTVQVDDVAPTGKVTVTLAGNGIPHFTIHENVAWDKLKVTPSALAAVRTADVICFGSLAQRSELSRNSIQKLVSAAPADSLRVFDINLRQEYFSREVIEESLQLANVLKLNDAELPILAKMFGLKSSPRQQIEKLAQMFGLKVVALTRGSEGSLLYKTGQWSDCQAVPVEVIDTVGAGDAFTAALVLGLLREMELDEINMCASEVARYVCSCAGATPPLPKAICNRFIARNSTLTAAPMSFAEARI
jgi:fructokinase